MTRARLLVWTALLVPPALLIVGWLVHLFSTSGVAALLDGLSARPGLLANTLVYALASGCFGTAAGWLLAHVLHTYRTPGGRVLRWLCLAPVMVPSFTLAMALIILVGHSGVVTEVLRLDGFEIYGAGGLVAAGTLARLPLPFLAMTWAYRRLDPAASESALNLGATPGQAYRRVVLPRLLPVLASSFLALAADAIADLANPLVIGGGFGTLARHLYEAVSAEGDLATAAADALLLAVPAMVLWTAAGRLAPTRAAGGATPRRSRRPGPVGWLLVGLAWSVGALIGALLVAVAAASVMTVVGPEAHFTTDNLLQILSGQRHRALATTVLVALITVPLVAATAFWVTVAATLEQPRSAVVQRTLDALAAVPAAVVGLFGYFVLDLVSGGLGALGAGPIAAVLVFVTVGVVHCVRFMPALALPVVRCRCGFPGVRDSALALGASRGNVARYVVWPAVRPELLGGAITTFARSLTGVSSVILLSTAQVPLLPVRMLADIDAGRLPDAAAATVVLAGLIAVVGGGVALLRAAWARPSRALGTRRARVAS
ncbi:MAG: iron ABC transporter permease [Micropruina sp.]|nr:MAG: iron ABC transporter permease [Micropruina sp.]